MRSLFEHVLEDAPPEDCKGFYMQYAKVEEKFGLTRRAMHIYERATKAVPIDQRLQVYELYVKKARDFFGVPKVREVYETAIDAQEPFHLKDEDVKKMCTRYAQLELKLKEIDRVRAIFFHTSQFADPKQDIEFWKEWNQFEIRYGTEYTFRDMLHIKRSVGAFVSINDIMKTHDVLSTSTNESVDARITGVKREREVVLAASDAKRDSFLCLRCADSQNE